MHASKCIRCMCGLPVLMTLQTYEYGILHAVSVLVLGRYPIPIPNTEVFQNTDTNTEVGIPNTEKYRIPKKKY